MAHFLAFIRKADFIDLFKYGSFHVNKDMIREFTCNVEDLPFRKSVFGDVTHFANGFDSTFTYLFIHYEKNQERSNDINIIDVRGVYPLDKEAKIELSLSLDSRIEIHEPLWPDAVLELQKKQTEQECINGVKNLWKIYRISDSIEDIRTVVNDAVLKELVDELYENRRPHGDLPIWVYIMRYERHAFYPDNTIGAFMDTFNVIVNYYRQQEIDSAFIETELIMQFFQKCNEYNPKMTFNDVVQKLNVQTDSRITNFINYTKTIVSDFDLIKTTTLFFIYRNRYKDGLKYEEAWIEPGKELGKEFSVACYLLGCILGHEHTYDCLYEHLPLAIFKKEQIEVVPPPVPEPKTKESKLPIFPCKMGKPKKKGGGYLKKPIPQVVNDKETYDKLMNEGWKVITENKGLW